MLSDYQDLVDDLVRDDSARLTDDDRNTAIDLAVKRYSKDRPKTQVEDLTPTSTTELPLPSAWETDFSVLASLEYPIGENPLSYLSPDRYGPYDDGTAISIKLQEEVDAAQDVRASFTIAHTLSAAVDTIPTGDREPVACWAAAILCEQLAAFYSGGTDATIQADSVRQQSKAQEYAAPAKNLRARYTNELGVNEKRNVAAGAVTELRKESSAGQTRLTHPMRRTWN